jgi:glycosyltransferase involved in cell wall biosynthesis
MNSMKILIITNAFPPLNAIASLRPYSWAKYWSEAGHDICVLTTVKTSSSGPLDLEMEPAVAARVRVVETPFLVFRGGFGKESGSRPTSSQAGASLQLARKLIRWLRKNIFGSFLDSRMFWIAPAVREALKIYKTWKFDLVVSTYDPPAAHIIAARLHRRLDVPWAADYRDLWADSHLEKPIFPLDRLERLLENRTMSGATMMSTVSEALRSQLMVRFSQPVITVANGYDVEKSLPGESSFFPQDCCKRIIYTGKVYQGRQNPTPLFQALADLRDKGNCPPGKVEVIFFGQLLDHIPRLISKYRIGDMVNLMGFRNRRTILRIQKEADLLLFLDYCAPAVDGILTGKIYEYMAAGRPVLGIGMDESKAAARLIHEAGIGVTFGCDPVPIASFLLDWINGAVVPYNPDPEVIRRYSRRRLAEKLLHEILSALGNTPG